MQDFTTCSAYVMLTIVVQLAIGCASGSILSGQVASDSGAQLDSSAVTEGPSTAPTVADGGIEEGVSSEDKIQRAAEQLGFTRLRLDGKRIVYVNNNNFMESYDNWMIDTPVIEFGEGQKPLKDSDLQKLEAMLEQIQRDRTEGFGAAVVDAPSPCTLKQILKLTSLRLNTLDDAVSQISMVRSFGSAVVMAEVRDSQTDEVILAYSATASLGGGTAGHGGPQIDRLGRELRRVLDSGSVAIQKRFPYREERIDNRKHLGCSGLMGQRVFQLRSEQGQ
ncbi:MAG: hypothetical protein HKO06_03665 [Pseudomonadales bacterium]|nr:hypothetical protein [Pseudomonadales bacterium]